MQFHETVRGKTFFEQQLPHLIMSINRLADSLNHVQELQQKPAADHCYIGYVENFDYPDIEFGSTGNLSAATERNAAMIWFTEQVLAAKNRGMTPREDHQRWVDFIPTDLDKHGSAILHLYANGDPNAARHRALHLIRVPCFK